MDSIIPFTKRRVSSLEGVKLQSKLFQVVFLHLFGFLLTIAIFNDSKAFPYFLLSKNAILMLLAFYCRQTVNNAAITLYLMLLLTSGVYWTVDTILDIFKKIADAENKASLSRQPVEPDYHMGEVSVIFLLCAAHIVACFFLTKYFIDYYQSQNSKLRDQLLGNKIPRMVYKV